MPTRSRSAACLLALLHVCMSTKALNHRILRTSKAGVTTTTCGLGIDCSPTPYTSRVSSSTSSTGVKETGPTGWAATNFIMHHPSHPSGNDEHEAKH
ncbi:hypothetical protein OOU_Y34scaffold00538g4 [Pyricularia oryzae Y34]|uniref:Secreted protein n=1 Tax=Pyricularia oryzae (strain Y34) TaxID=1143189 RepID=A0AA97NYA2_PYRO3|nr:hypothetical protein OOU_Y34scaffold00538g4 [Pyricularia oryzae Y34]